MRDITLLIHLIGHPGVGKYTIAKEIADSEAREGRQLIVVDNHYINNPIFALLDLSRDAAVPAEAWPNVRQVREAILQTIESLSPRTWSFIFTNVLVESDPEDVQIVERLMLLANRRKSIYVPVNLICNVDELTRRAKSYDRKERLKLVDPDAVRSYSMSRTLLTPTIASAFSIDVTKLSSTDAAQEILKYVNLLRHN